MTAPLARSSSLIARVQQILDRPYNCSFLHAKKPTLASHGQPASKWKLSHMLLQRLWYAMPGLSAQPGSLILDTRWVFICNNDCLSIGLDPAQTEIRIVTISQSSTNLYPRAPKPLQYKFRKPSLTETKTSVKHLARGRHENTWTVSPQLNRAGTPVPPTAKLGCYASYFGVPQFLVLKPPICTIRCRLSGSLAIWQAE